MRSSSATSSSSHVSMTLLFNLSSGASSSRSSLVSATGALPANRSYPNTRFSIISSSSSSAFFLLPPNKFLLAAFSFYFAARSLTNVIKSSSLTSKNASGRSRSISKDGSNKFSVRPSYSLISVILLFLRLISSISAAFLSLSPTTFSLNCYFNE